MGERLLCLTEFAENIFCIYRNYFMRGKLCKLWMTCRIIVELFLIVSSAITWIKHYNHLISDIIYVVVTSWHSAFILFVAVYHSGSYASFKIHLNFGYRVFVKDHYYRKNLAAKHKALVFLVISIALSKSALFVYSFLPEYTTDIHWFWHYFIQFLGVICDLRYIFEYLVLYCFLYVMYEQITSITRSLNGEKSLLNHELIVQIVGPTKQKMVSKVHKWCLGYKHVRQSCKLFNTIFGFQLTSMLTTAIVFYIVVMYSTTSESLKGHLPPVGVVMYTANLFLMLYLLFMLSYSAQQMQNSADVLRRRLCKALILSLSEGSNYQETKDLLRMMSTCPIRVQAFGSVPIDMTLFPTCISFFTTYTVIALQFTNVL